jgi:tripartite ATP-independent transporter DctP family solute receptor
MMNITRRRLGALTAIAALALTTSVATAQDKPLRLSTSASATEGRGEELAAYASRTSGVVSLEMHFNSTLFAQGTELMAIQRGNLDMTLVAPQDIAKQIPEWSIFTAGYLLRDPMHLTKVFEADVGKEMAQLVSDKLGVVVISPVYQGRRQVNLKGDKEIKTPADLAGVKLRMPGSPEWLFLGEALGASPSPMAFAEVYTGLQTGTIDGQDNPLPAVFDRKFYEVTDQIVLTSHLVDFTLLVVGKKAFDALSAEQQAKLMEEGRVTATKISQRQIKSEAELVAYFEGKGLKVYEPDLDAFRSQVQAKYLESDFSSTWIDGMVDRINAVE